MQILNSLPSLIDKTFPIPGRFRGALPSNIAELSRLLTNNRGSRSLSYLSRPDFLSAYLHYFLPWNLCRLCFLLPGLDLALSPGDTITDIGCGPLTFASALWTACPSLRKIPLEINCIDRSGRALEAGKKFFSALCESAAQDCGLWKINLIKEDIDLRKAGIGSRGKTRGTPSKAFRGKAALVCAVNMFNEIYENLPHSDTEGLRRTAADAAKLMQNEAKTGGAILTVEPGVPQSGRFISFLREAFLELNYTPSSPCTHSCACPCLAAKSGGRTSGKNRWCHFVTDSSRAPKELHNLSAAAKLPKQRLVFSFLFAEDLSAAKAKKTENSMKIRVISDAFSLPDSRFGRYGCSKQGLVLLAGNRDHIEGIPSGSLYTVNTAAGAEARDQKSGAIIIDLPMTLPQRSFQQIKDRYE